ncbi:MAG: aldo/keto reductase [Bacillota bacterium]|jgi:predicted aldo/keto reductase-like oxidoreductase
MYYNEFQGKQISALGFGAMRLPTVGEDDSRIDADTAAEMVDYAIAHGVNYFDTAWGYHGGNSETVMGDILKKYDRESFFLATKFPGYDLSNMDKVEEIFERQLEKCGVDYFDFYLFHNVCEINIDAYLDERHGIAAYLREQKKNGRIRHLGFSAHGNLDTLRRFLEAYGDDMEFCQLQVNYIDWEFQQAKEKVALMKEHGIPVWVMEPLRGGKAVRIPDEYMTKLQSLRPDETAVSWAFRFLQGIPEITVTLSGMSDMAQLKDNIAIYGEKKATTEKENEVLMEIGEKLMKGVPCTGCRYCVSHCPQELNIPELLDLYNEHTFTKGGFLAPFAIQAMPEDKRPDACVACESCVEVCPQNIQIPDILADFVEKLK